MTIIPPYQQSVADVISGLSEDDRLGKNDIRLALAVLGITYCASRERVLLDCRKVGPAIKIREDHCRDAFARLLSFGWIRRNDDESVSLVVQERTLSSVAALVTEQTTVQEVLALQSSSPLPDPALGSGSGPIVSGNGSASSTETRATFDVHEHCERFRAALASGPDALKEFEAGSQIPESGIRNPEATGSPNSGIGESLMIKGSQIPEFGNEGVRGSLSLAKLCTKKLSLAEGQQSAPPATVETEKVLGRLEALLQQTKANERQVRQWLELLTRDASYVVGLWRRLESRLTDVTLPPVKSRLAWMARIARDERRLN